MTDAGLSGPADFFDILSLAGIIVFFITSISAVLSSIFIKKDNLLYLGIQLILLSLFLHLSTRWTYRAWFTGLYSSEGQQLQFVDTMFVASIAYTCDVALRVVVWDRMLARQGQRSVPTLLLGSVRVVIYLFALLIALQFVFDQSITALATLSGAVAVIFGLSAQSTLGEMFAGIALALSRPFSIGDWVKIGNLEEGRVIDMTWRMTRIETRSHVVLNVPNRVAADQTVQNFTHPNRVVQISETICFPQSEDRRAIQELLERALADAPGIMPHPKPSLLYRGVKDGVCEYSMRYYLADYKDKDTASENVWTSVIDHVARSDIRIAFPRRYLDIGTDALRQGSAG